MQKLGFIPRPALINISGFNRPDPAPAYFAGIPWGPIGALRRTLSANLPSGTILHVSFIGKTITEILCDRQHGQKLVDALTAVGAKYINEFDPSSVSPRITDESLKTKYRKACLKRWTDAMNSSRSPACRSWFKTQIESLTRAFPDTLLPDHQPSDSPNQQSQPN